MKVVLLNVKYSPNLGDGVIAECLEHELSHLLPDSNIVSLDISGMTTYGSSSSIVSSKFKLMTLIRKLPSFILKPIFLYIMPLAVNKKYADAWARELVGCNCMVIGGGQLLMDVDQYFPMRINLAVSQANAKSALAVYAVGVSNKMTEAGIKLFNSVFKQKKPIFISVRDENAGQKLKEYFKYLPQPVVTRDPGLLTSNVYGFESFKSNSDVIAFGVSDPLSMSPHADSTEGVVCSSFDFYLNSICELTKSHQVHMFTNGEDFEYLDLLAQKIMTLPEEVKSKVKILPRALKPIELIRQIYNSKLMIAHRLHANIIAYSLGIPHIGLGWDDKLKSFFNSIDRPEFLITSNKNAVINLMYLTNKSLEEGIDQNMHKKVILEAKDGLEQLANAIVRSSV